MSVLLNECFYFLLSVLADSSLLKSVLECSPLKASSWKDHHPLDTEDKVAVGLASEDEVEGLDAVTGVSHQFQWSSKGAGGYSYGCTSASTG